MYTDGFWRVRGGLWAIDKIENGLVKSYFDYYQKCSQKLIDYIDKRRRYIPFPSLIIWYLKAPLYLKLIVGFMIGLITAKLFYAVGFIVLQSKAKNEVLSIISAYHNPINFEDVLVYKYSFIFCLIVICALLPFIVPFLIHIFIFSKDRSSVPISRKNRLLRIISIIVFHIFLFVTLLWGVVEIVPEVAYVMLYTSKDASVVEYIIRRIVGEEPSFSLNDVTFLNPEYLNSQIKYSVIIEEWIFLSLILLTIILRLFGKKSKRNFLKFFSILFSILISTVILLVLFSHIFYFPGYFGKAISNFNMDFISVEYELNGTQHVEGIRIFEKDNLVIVRDSCNVTHDIISTNIHMRTIKEISACTSTESHEVGSP